jgi:hypothetical protein
MDNVGWLDGWVATGLSDSPSLSWFGNLSTNIISAFSVWIGFGLMI